MRRPLDQQIAEVAREVALRGAVYPRLIAAGKLSRAAAREQLARLRAALRTLERLRRHGKKIAGAIGEGP